MPLLFFFNLVQSSKNPKAPKDNIIRIPKIIYLFDKSAQITEERITDLKKQEENKKAEVDLLESKTEKDLWKNDLDEFEKEYKKWMKKFEQSIKDEKNAKVNVSTKNKGKNKNRSKGKKA